jgi:hypothetical protein
LICNLYRYAGGKGGGGGVGGGGGGTDVWWYVDPDASPPLDTAVGLCTLNQVDPYPITYSLLNP